MSESRQRLRQRIALLGVAALLSACVTAGLPPPGKSVTPRPAEKSSHGSRPIGAWPLAQLAATEHPLALLSTPDGPVGVLSTKTLRAAWQASQRLLAVIVGESPEMLVAEGGAPNAYAFEHDGQPKIALNYAMLRLLGDDEAAWAALIGHELAHLNLRHQQVREARQSRGEAARELLGIALVLAGLPLGGAVSDGATELLTLGYSRDDERAADRRGVEYMIAAAYDPEGAVRLQEHLARAAGKEALRFLSTHPQGAERVEAMRALVRELSGHSSADK